MAIARSYSLAGNTTNALALTKYAYDSCKKALPILSTVEASSTSDARNIVVTPEDIGALDDLLIGELQRSRALVEISRIQKAANVSGGKGLSIPLVERLTEYPASGVDLENIVVYPPKLEPVPVKPIFLDVAWNYIDYPDKQTQPPQASKEKAPEVSVKTEPEAKPQKKGWFGFGR